MIESVQNLNFLEEAKSLYGSSWERTHDGRAIASESYSGSIYDIDVLNYCEYELGHPDNSYRPAALIWGNVIESNTNLNWGCTDGQYYLYTSDKGYKCFSLNVYAFIMDIVDSQVSQHCSFSIATEMCLLNMINSNYGIEELSNLQSIVVAGVEKGNDCYSSGIAYAAGVVFGENPKQIEALHEHIGLGQGEER